MSKSSTVQGKLVLLIGPSGVGKSIILKRLRQRHPELHFPRSATTRKRRPREGDDLYRFVTEEEFDRLKTAGKLLEWASVHNAGRYGTLSDEIIPAIEKGMIVVREVDVQGFESIRSHPLFAGGKPRYRLQSIFILPESKAQLIHRITRRAPISEEELRSRLQSMERELRRADACSAQVRNREGALEETVHEVEEHILTL